MCDVERLVNAIDLIAETMPEDGREGPSISQISDEIRRHLDPLKKDTGHLFRLLRELRGKSSTEATSLQQERNGRCNA